MDKSLERFLQHVSSDTQSKPDVHQIPSTKGQWKLLCLLQAQLEEMGLVKVTLNEKGTIVRTLFTNVEGDIPAISFISHVDASPDFSGKSTNPQTIEDCRGGGVALGIDDEVLSPVMFPVLHRLLRQTLITTDGKILLRMDDRASIARIMTTLATLQAGNIPRGDICVAFTPDEEVEKGAKRFDVGAFNAHWAYTVNGGSVGKLESKSFNTVLITIKVVGNNVCPDTTKGMIINTLSLATRIHAEVPAGGASGTAEGYESFYHLTSIKGSMDRAEMHYIIHDFDRKHFEVRERKMMKITEKVGKGLHPDCYIELVVEDSYYNMHEQVIAHPHVVDIIHQAMVDCNIEPQMRPICGDTGGAQSSLMGLPCPNLFTGDYDYHGKHEFITLEGIERTAQTIMRIAELTTTRRRKWPSQPGRLFCLSHETPGGG